MKDYIKFKNLDNIEQDYYLERVVAAKLQLYIQAFTKMKKAGLTTLEIIQLRGLPLTPSDIREKLLDGRIIINNTDDNILEIIEPEHKDKQS